MRGDDAALQTAQAFVANAPVPMALLSLDGRLLAVSPLLLHTTLGPDAIGEALVGADVTTISPIAGPGMQEVLEKLRGGVRIVKSEFVLPDGAGGQVHARAQTSYWRDGGGDPAAVLCVVQDIGGEVAARDALAESAAQLRAIVEHMPAQIS